MAIIYTRFSYLLFMYINYNYDKEEFIEDKLIITPSLAKLKGLYIFQG